MLNKNADLQVFVALPLFMCFSMGMMLCNKIAIDAFPFECTLLGSQMIFTVFCMLAVWPTLHFGSVWDVLRWLRVVPFFGSMLLTGLVALKHAPMSLVVTARVLSPLMSLVAEAFFPNPVRVNVWMVGATVVMLGGAVLYTAETPASDLSGIPWIVVNLALGVGDRLMHRLMLGADQHPVDISLTGTTLINNLAGAILIMGLAFVKGEFSELPAAWALLDTPSVMWILSTGVVGCGISFVGMWTQKLVSATSFIVLQNVNKFAIIFVEAYCMGSRTLSALQMVGALTALSGGVLYSQATEKSVNDKTK